jgi:hypothetical protein
VKISHFLWLVLVLYGCNNTAPTQEAEPLSKAIEQLGWLTTADSNKDVKVAIANKDYRLLAISGRGTMLPGIVPEQAKRAKAQCGLHFMPGMGDSITNKEHKKWWQKGRDYATRYNVQMIKYCLNI